MNPQRSEEADTGGGPSPHAMQRAKEIFLAVRSLRGIEREDAIDRMTSDDPRVRAMVFRLLRGDAAPLPVESLADDIRAAQDMRQGERAAPVGAAETLRAEASDGDGTRIGRYRLLERIGEGGFGVVFMAEQQEPVRRRVALKVIKLGMDTRQVIARFEAERQALAMMDHPGIAKVFDAGATTTGRPYFVMELVRGVPITDYCDQRKLGIRERLRLFAQVCDAIQHAHQKGIIHRDIKPSNVLVTEQGESTFPKVIDFGIAKATNATLTDKTLFTEMRQMIGTPEYMSPEQAAVTAMDVDTRTDVYSLGVLLYELLAGATPFDSRRLRSAAYGEVQRIIREEDPPRPSVRLSTLTTRASVAALRGGIEPARLGTALKGELDWVVMKCLEKDRGRRYDSASALMRDVRRFVEGEAVQAVPPSASYRARKFIRKNRGPVIAGSLLAVALVCGLAGTTAGYLNAERQRKTAVDEGRRADRKAEEAQLSEARAQRQAYSASMLMACNAIATNSYSVASVAIDGAPEPMRGWEWRTLHARLDTSTRSLACPVPDRRGEESSYANQLIVHPDGRSFFTVRPYEVEVCHRWDLLTGARLAVIPRPGSSKPSPYSPARVVVSPDGSKLTSFTGSSRFSPDCRVSVWDLKSNERVVESDLATMPGITGTLGATSDGSALLRCDHESRTLFLQDTQTGGVLARAVLPESWHDFVWFSGDGSMFAGYNAMGLVSVVSTESLTITATLEGHKNVCHGMDFSRDGRFLATASIDATARIWDLQAQPPSCVVLDHGCGVETILFSPDGSLVATAGTDLALRVWDPRTAELKGVYGSSDGLLRGALMFLPDGRTIAGRERDGTVRFWDITADETVNLRGHRGYINRASFAPAAGLIISAGWDGWKGQPGCLRLWDAETGEPVAAVGAPGEVAYFLAVSPDGSRAAVSITATDSPWTPRDRVQQNRVEILDLLTARTVTLDLGHVDASEFGDVDGLAFSPDGTQVVLARRRCLDVVSAVDGSLLRRRSRVGEMSQGGSWSPDGRSIACIMSDGVRPGSGGRPVILDAVTLETIRELDHRHVYSLVFSADGRTVATGAADGFVRLFDAATGHLVHEHRAHTQKVNSLAFSPDGTRLATVCGDEGDITIWNTATWDRVAQFHEKGFVGSADWDSSGERLVGGCYQTVRTWDQVPLRDRVRLRDERQAAVLNMQPRVQALLAEGAAPHEAVSVVQQDALLTPLQKRVGHQLLLQAALSPK